ncbi:MAG: DnaD domain protein, partial [Clostridiales bacterium]|nr:DnaD domain protein [Candidatus Equinaster intestinalis]
IMGYSINPAVFGSLFSLPADIADKHLKLASATQLKVILYLFRHLSELPTVESIANALRLDIGETEDALLYWSNSGIISLDEAKPQKPQKQKTEEKPKKAVRQKLLPSREDVGIRAAQNPVFKELLDQAQIKFGRFLKTNESEALLWLLEDEGMDISVILMLFEYAAGENKLNISFIERTATAWLNAGVTTISDAERYIKEFYEKKTAWKVVEKAFGIEDRLPSEKELEYSKLWISDWKFDDKMLKAAYDKCVDTKSKFIMSYVAKILEGFHSKGYKTAEDIKAGEDKKPEKNDYSGHDIASIEKMINKGYGEEQ